MRTIKRKCESLWKKAIFVKRTWQQDIVNITAKCNSYCSIEFKIDLVY